MRVDWAIPCQAAQVENGLMTIIGAQIDTLYAGGFPAKLTTWIAIRLAFPDAELGERHTVALRLIGPQLEALGEVSRTLKFDGANPDKAPGWEGSHLMASAIQFDAVQPGAYTIEVMLDGRHQKTLPFSVRLAADAPA